MTPQHTHTQEFTETTTTTHFGGHTTHRHWHTDEFPWSQKDSIINIHHKHGLWTVNHDSPEIVILCDYQHFGAQMTVTRNHWQSFLQVIMPSVIRITMLSHNGSSPHRILHQWTNNK